MSSGLNGYGRRDELRKQIKFADAEYAGKRKQTRKGLLLIEMDQVVTEQGLIWLIEPHYPKSEYGLSAYALHGMPFRTDLQPTLMNKRW